MSKYGNTPTVLDGVRFDSKGEARRWGLLQLMQASGMIRDLERQVVYELQPAFKRADGTKARAITYRADFRYWDCESGRLVVEDYKGVETRDFKLKKLLFEYRYPHIEFRISGAA
jgi:Protein of unknown function (DUF1064)